MASGVREVREERDKLFCVEIFAEKLNVREN